MVLETLAGPEHEQARAALRIEFQAERARTGFPPRPDFPPLPEPADDATTTTTPATGRGGAGRFAPGNRCGQGPSLSRQMAALRRAAERIGAARGLVAST